MLTSAVGSAEVESLVCVTMVVEVLPLKSSSRSAKYHLSCTSMGFKCACQSRMVSSQLQHSLEMQCLLFLVLGTKVYMSEVLKITR